MSANPLRKPDRAEGREVVSIRPAGEPNRAEARARASTISKLPPAPPEGSPEGSLPGYVPSRLADVAVVLATRAAGLSKVSPLRDAQASMSDILTSAADIWACHRDAAQHWNAVAARWLRYAYGAVHTASYAAAQFLFAVTFSPAGLVVLAALVVACHFWLF